MTGRRPERDVWQTGLSRRVTPADLLERATAAEALGEVHQRQEGRRAVLWAGHRGRGQTASGRPAAGRQKLYVRMNPYPHRHRLRLTPLHSVGAWNYQ